MHLAARAETFTELDSTNLALALGNFDVRLDQPHAPGYPLVVVVAHGLTWLGGGRQAYLAFALIATGGAVVATFLLGRELFGLRAGVAAALLLVASPLVLYYASIVSVYPGELLFGPLVVLVAARVARGADTWSVIALAPALALGAGFRPTMVGLLLPVCVLAVAVGRPPVRPLLIGVALGAAIVAAWAIPMLMESGGLSGYRHASELYSRASARTSLLKGASLGDARYNAIEAIVATILAALASLIVLALGALRGGLRAMERLPWLLLGAWLAPYLLLYVFVHFGKPGYAVICVPAFCVAAGGAVRDERFAVPVAAGLATAAIGFFLFVPTLNLPGKLATYNVSTFVPTADSIRLEDDEARFLARVGDECPPSTCTIVSLGTSRELWDHEPWSVSRWYARDARVVRPNDLNHQAPPGATVYWIGAQIPAAVPRVGRPIPAAGRWRAYVTQGEQTPRLEALLELH